MRISDEQLRDIVKRRVSVSHQNVVIAKGLLLKHFQPNTDAMISAALRELGIVRPERVTIRGEEDATGEVQKLGDYFSWTLCAVEAIWSLINTGVLLPTSSSLNSVGTTIQITRTMGGSSSSGGEDFGTVVTIPGFPQSLVKSQLKMEGFVISDPDLFLNALRPHVPAGDVAEALRESIRCFRAELYLACAVMLGMASEGTWIELGKALIDALPTADRDKRVKLRADLDNTVRPSFAIKLRDVESLYATNQRQFAQVAVVAGFGLDQFRLAYQWADLVRDSRNVVHYGSQPNIPNNYSNVSTLLLAGATHLRNLLALRAAALANPGL